MSDSNHCASEAELVDHAEYIADLKPHVRDAPFRAAHAASTGALRRYWLTGLDLIECRAAVVTDEITRTRS